MIRRSFHPEGSLTLLAASSTPCRVPSNQPRKRNWPGQRIYPIEEESIDFRVLIYSVCLVLPSTKQVLMSCETSRSVVLSGLTIAECLPKYVVAYSFRSNRRGLNIFHIRCRIHPPTQLSSFFILIESRKITQPLCPIIATKSNTRTKPAIRSITRTFSPTPIRL